MEIPPCSSDSPLFFSVETPISRISEIPIWASIGRPATGHSTAAPAAPRAESAAAAADAAAGGRFRSVLGLVLGPRQFSWVGVGWVGCCLLGQFSGFWWLVLGAWCPVFQLLCSFCVGAGGKSAAEKGDLVFHLFTRGE